MSVVFPIEDDLRYRRYTASAGQIAFSIPFPFQDDRDLAILRLEDDEYVELAPVEYTITGAGSPTGGTVTTPVNAEGQVILVLGRAILDRLSSIVAHGRFASALTDAELDRNRIIHQELRRDINQSLRVAFGSPLPKPFTPETGKVLGFDENLQPRMYINSAAEAELAADRAEAALADTLIVAGDVLDTRDEVRELRDETEGFRDEAEDFRDQAQLAAAAAMIAGMIFPSTAAGIAGTTDGQYFWVFEIDPESGFPFAQAYLNVAEVAVAQPFSLASHAAFMALYALIGPAEQPLEVKDPNGYLVARFGAQESTVSGLVVGDGEAGIVEFVDRSGYIYARLAPMQSSVNGFNFKADFPGPIEFHDKNGYVYGSIGVDESTLNGLIIRTGTNTDIEVTDNSGYVLARFGRAESMVGGVVMRPDGAEFEVHDRHGYILWSASMAGSSSGSSEPVPSSTTPIFGRFLYGVEGEPTTLVLDNLLADRMDAPLCQASILPATGLARSFENTIELETETMGGSAPLVVRPRRWNGDVASELNMTVRVAPNPPAVPPASMKILLMGDSIPTYQGLYWQKQYLTGWGYTPEWIGTQVTEGDIPVPGTPRFENDGTLLGETNPGHELADATYLLMTTVSPLAPGEEAAYAAMTLAQKRLKNTFLKAQDGSYPAGDVRNGYAVDFDWYFTRHGLAPADILQVSYGTNDITQQTAVTINARILTEIALLRRRWRAHSATKPMVVGLPGTGRGLDRDPVWKSKYIPAIRALLEFKQTVDPNLHVVPLHGHVIADSGYDMTPATGVPDAVTGVISRQIIDPLHPTGIARANTWRMMAAASAYAITHVV